MSAKDGGRKKKPSATTAAGGAAKAATAPGKTTGGRAAKKGPAATTAAAKKTGSSATTGATAKTGVAKTGVAKTDPGVGRKKEGASASRSATTAGASPGRKRRGAKLDAKALGSIRVGLVAEKAELLQRLTELDQESFEGSQSEMSGEVGLGEDYADAGTATFDRERDLSIHNNIQDLMDQIDRAIERIDAGTYGICERCGKPIEAARLRALPHSVLCLDCKRRDERTR